MRIFRVVLLIFFLKNYTVSSFEDYCTLPCGFAKHIACIRKPENCGQGRSCIGYKKAEFTAKERQKILDKHNEIRSKIATGKPVNGVVFPKAANMKALKYNAELEYIASCTANTCIFKHDDCRRTREFPYVGQNIGVSGHTKLTPEKYIDHNLQNIENWINEIKNMPNKNLLKSFKSPVVYDPSKEYRHFTQVIWADTEYLGCARAGHLRFDLPCVNLVCNYGSNESSGNILHHPIYLQGEPCSKCPNTWKCSKKWPGLCTDSADNNISLVKDKKTEVVISGSGNKASQFWDQFLIMMPCITISLASGSVALIY